MSGIKLLFWVLFATYVLGGVIGGICSVISDRRDRYKGVRKISLLIKDKMDSRWLHDRCLVGHGSVCRLCRKFDECYKECEEYVKRIIDEEQDEEKKGGAQ